MKLSDEEEDALFTLRVAALIHMFENTIELQENRVWKLFSLTRREGLDDHMIFKARYRLHSSAVKDEETTQMLMRHLSEVGVPS